MNKLKFLFASLFVMFAFAAHAQQVVINKTDGTSEVFQPNEVDSVVYKPAPKYYYYAGWECPKNEAELAKNGTLLENYEKLKSGAIIKDYIANELVNTSYKKYYVVIPTGCGVYSADGTNVTFDFQNTQTKQFGSIDYVIVESDYEEKRIDAIIIKKN